MTPTYFKDGHLFFRVINKPDSILGDRLIINPENLKEACAYIRNNGIKSITVNPAYYPVDNLNFLNDFLFIEGIYILQDNLDLSQLNRLSNLRALSFNESKTKIDLSNFPNLEILGITYNKNIVNLCTCNKLFWLWLEDFKKDNLEELSTLTELKYLTLNKTEVLNLSGISGLTNLISLKIDSAIKLKTLDGISENNKHLEVIDIYGTKNLRDYSALANAKSIQRIFLRKTGEVHNIAFLKQLKNIEEVIIGMKVTDGDIRYLKEIEKAGFLDFPHYNLKMKDLAK